MIRRVIRDRLSGLMAIGRWREPPERFGAEPTALFTPRVDVRSNDYLGLAALPVSRETSPDAEETSAGAGASRLVGGSHAEHLALEAELAEWLQFEEALLFSSAYAANVGVISCLAGVGDVILSDALNHASIVDGCRLSRARTVVVPHNDVSALARAAHQYARTGALTWVAIESYYGMDADTPDLTAIRALCDATGAALIVDEAHALGVFGPEGSGLCAERGVRPDLVIGGFGKALGAQGGFVACDRVFRDWIWNRARTLVYSTGTSPVFAQLQRRQLRRVRGADLARQRLRRLGQRLETQLAPLGAQIPAGRHGPIFPIIVGSEEAALNTASALRAAGFACQPIRPPTVPPGQSRLRVSLRADLAEEDVDALGEALGRLAAVESRTATPVTIEPSTAPSRLSEGEAGAPAKRWVILGTGTGVGKTYVAAALVRLCATRGLAVAGLKPVETGIAPGQALASDAGQLEAVSFHVKHPQPHPLHAFAAPIAPARAARATGVRIQCPPIRQWVESTRGLDGTLPHLVVETAGGAFSPINDAETNFDLARQLGRAVWVLVAPDRLGVLHDVASSLLAMASMGRSPDCLVLSAPAVPDPSTGANSSELQRRHPGLVVIEASRDGAPEELALLLSATSWP